MLLVAKSELYGEVAQYNALQKSMFSGATML